LLIAPVQFKGARWVTSRQSAIAMDFGILRSSTMFDARFWLDWDERRAPPRRPAMAESLAVPLYLSIDNIFFGDYGRRE